MTDGPTPGGSPFGNNDASTQPAPAVIQTVPDVAGGQDSILHDVWNAGLDPGMAFGAAYGLNRLLGRDAFKNWANSRVPASASSAANGSAPHPPQAPQTSLDGADQGAGRILRPGPGGTVQERADSANAPGEAQRSMSHSSQAPQTSLDGSAASPMDTQRTAELPRPKVEPSAAPARGEELKAAQRSLSQAFAEDGAKKAVKEAGVLAAKRGAMVGTKAVALAGLRLGAMSVPGLGTALTLALWCIDPSERRAVNNLISSMFGVGGAPALDAPPEPPRTQFLPLTHDGNRDGTIEQMDRGMAATNRAAFGYHPDDVWPTSSPAIPTTSDFPTVGAKVTALSSQLANLAESVGAAYQAHQDEPYVAQLWAKTKPGVDALGELQSTVLPAIGRQVMNGAAAANDAYQGFRSVNLINRKEINNSTSGLLPFMPNHVNAGKMSDSTAEIKAAVQEMHRIATAVASAADSFTIAPNRAADAAPTTSATTPAATEGDTLGQSHAAAPGAAGATASPAEQAKPADNTARDLASMLRSAMPQGNPMSMMPGIPTMPGLGGLPQIPGLGNAGRPVDFAKPADNAALRNALDDRMKSKDNPGDNKKPTDIVGAGLPGPVHSETPARAVPAANPGPAAPAGPSAANTTEIGGKKYTFDNPKLAALAHNLTGTDGAGHKSVQQAASEAGFKLPPLGQDIGQEVATADLKPGDVVMGANNHNAVFLGEVDGKAMTITEQGEVKALDELNNFDGPHQGYYRLADDGAATPTAQIQQASAESAPPSTGATDPGVGTGQASGPIGLSPGDVPTGN